MEVVEGVQEEREVWGGVWPWPDPPFYTGHIPGSLRPAGTQPVISNPINIIIIPRPAGGRHQFPSSDHSHCHHHCQFVESSVFKGSHHKSVLLSREQRRVASRNLITAPTYIVTIPKTFTHCFMSKSLRINSGYQDFFPTL